MKGQFKIEFILGLVIFGIIIMMIVSQLNTMYSDVAIDAVENNLKAGAINTINYLVNDPGEPDDWTPTNYIRIGLALTPHNLSKNKIYMLESQKDVFGNCELLEDVGLKNYQMTIYNSTAKMLSCGYDMIGSPSIVVTRPVMIENEPGNITLVVWK